MAKIDIRDVGDEPTTRIVFAEYDRDEEFVERDGDTVRIQDCTDGRVHVYIEDIPNLIKALQKAQELWATPE